MAETSGRYDVAISFVGAAEATAVELSEAMAGRLRTFVYSERQRELVGRDGMAEFTRVFGRDSRVVVVLYQRGWGQTLWTRVEQTAIQERGFREGWDFLVFAPLDETALPDWLPTSRIWFNFARFRVAGLAAVVEQRFQDTGGTPVIENAVELAARLGAEKEIEARRRAFLASEDGVRLADSEVSQLFDEVQQLQRETTQSLSMAIERQGSEAVWLYRAGHTIAALWWRYANTLDGSELTLVKHRGRVGPNRYGGVQEPQLVSKEVLDFNIDPSGLPFWQTRALLRRFSSKTLADEIVQRALKFQNDDKQ
jgi:hypothetical protein